MKNNDPIFFPGGEIDVNLRQTMHKNYSDCINILQTQWYQADVDQRFVLGDQDIWGLIFPGVSTYKRKIFNFNLCNATLQMVSGYQRRNRKSTVCTPIKPEAQKTADQLTKCLFHVHNQSGAYQVYSDAFEQGALTQGLGFISIYKNSTHDPISGDISLRYIDMKSCLFDPYFRCHDMSDARYFWTRQFFDREEAAALYPEFADDILALPRGTYRDDKFYYMPEVYQIQFPNLIAFDEYWYLSTREATYLVDKETEECQEFQGDEEDLKDIMRMFKDKLVVIKKPRPTVRRTVLVNDKVLVDEPDPNGIDRYPVVPVLGYFTPDSPYYAYKFKGIIRDLRDCQFLINRLKVSHLDILDAQQQGIKMKKGSLVTPDDALNSGHGRVLVLSEKAQMTDVEQMPIIPPAPTMLQMEDMLKATFREISNVGDSLLGQDVSDQSALQTMMRNSAGITTLTKLFDQFDESQRLCGDIICKMIQKNWTYGKVKQVIGEEPTSEFDNKAFFDYGCKVVQGALTESQQQLNFQQLLYLRETTGIPIPSKLIIEASTLQNKDTLTEAIEQEEQMQAQQAQQAHQMQMQAFQVEMATKVGYANSQNALAGERMGKLQLDKALNAERIQRAEEDRSASVLNLVRAVKEIQGIDIQNLLQSLQIVEHLKQSESDQADEKATHPLPQEEQLMEMPSPIKEASAQAQQGLPQQAPEMAGAAMM